MLEAQKPVFSPNGASAIIVQPVQPGDGSGDTFQEAVQSIRDRIGEPDDGLEVKLTGAAGFSLDAIKVFSGINGTLLYAAAAIVLVLLIIIYRSPIFWAIPFFSVLLAEGASRGAGYLLAEAGVTINGQTGGILPVLVFGAGTDYALLLVSRYREELRRHEDKHEATAIALRSAGPAILASGLTVIAALLTLSIAEVNSTAGLGPVGAMGVALAMISMLTVLPALLAICGRRAFWSPGLDTIPHPGQAGHRRDARLLAPGRRPRGAPAAHDLDRRHVVLLVLAANVLNLDTSQTTGNQFRGEVDSVQGQEVLARNFPAGASAPADVIVGDAAKAEAVHGGARAAERPRRRRAPGGRGDAGVQLAVDLQGRPVRVVDDGHDPAAARGRRAGGRARHAGRRPDRAGVRPARVRHARQQADHPADAARRARDPDRAAARARRAAAADRLGDPVVRGRARDGHLRLRAHLRLHRRRARRCRCWRSSSWSRWGSTTTSS